MNEWPQVTLAEVMSTHIQAVPSALLTEVNLAGVYGFGRGLFRRGLTNPLETTYKRFHRLNAGDFVISSPKAWEGAVARIPDEFDGWFLSPVFPTFRADSSRLDTRYLEWYCRREAVWRQLQGKAKGMGARRESVSASQFLSLKIPLPTLPEQQSIVAHLDALSEKIRQATAHLDAIEADSEALVRSYLFGSEALGHPRREISSLLKLQQPDVAVDRLQRYQFAGVYSFGRGVFSSVNKAGNDFAYGRLSTLRAGNFVYPKLMAWEGALGVVPTECDGMVVSPEFPVFKVNENVILPEILDLYFRTPSVWPELASLSGGTNVRRRRLQPSAFLNYRMPVPPLASQYRIRELSRATQAIKRAHAGIREMTAALLPSTIERLFARNV